MITNGLVDPNGHLPINLTAAELAIDAAELYNVITKFRKETVQK